MTPFEREEEAIQEAYVNGEISNAEMWRQMRELQRREGEAMKRLLLYFVLMAIAMTVTVAVGYALKGLIGSVAAQWASNAVGLFLGFAATWIALSWRRVS